MLWWMFATEAVVLVLVIVALAVEVHAVQYLRRLRRVRPAEVFCDGCGAVCYGTRREVKAFAANHVCDKPIVVSATPSKEGDR